MVHEKEKALMIIIGLAVLSYSVFADFAQEQRDGCLNQNPLDRIVWDFQNGECVQVDCIQNSFDTNPIPTICKNKKLESKYYEVRYEFPACQPIYLTRYSLSSNEICSLCPEPRILTNYAPTQCLNGKKVLTRTFEKYIDSSCAKITATEFQQTNDSCIGTPLLDLNGAFILILAGIGVVAFIYFKKRG